MSKINKKIAFAAPLPPRPLDPRYHGSKFSLSFLDEEPPAGAISLEDFVNELLTATEKAAYYRDLVKRGGQPDMGRVAKRCRNKAAKMRERARQLDPDEAKFFLRKARALEGLAADLENPVPLDVLESQAAWEYNSSRESNSPAALAAKEIQGIENAPVLLGPPTPKQLEARREAERKADGRWRLTDGEDVVDDQGWPNLHWVFEPGVRGEKKAEVKDFQKKALFWKNIHNWNYDQRLLYYFCGPRKPSDWEEAIFVRAQQDPFAMKLLLTRSGSIDRLLDLANMGNAEAAKAAIQLVADLVRKLNAYAKFNPEPFRTAARQLTHWPVMYSPHPALNQNVSRISARIELGAAYPFHVVPEAEWDPRELGCNVALHLYHYVNTVRQNPQSHREFPFAAAAAQLPPITDAGAANQWWAVAKQTLLFSYPKPELNPNLRSLTEIKKRGKVRNKILDCLKRRFFSLFPKSAR